MEVKGLSTSLGVVDIVVTVLILVGIARGFSRGLVREIISLVGFVVAIAVANSLHGGLASALSNVLGGMISALRTPLVARAVAFFIIVIVVGGIANVIGTVVQRAVGLVFPGCLNRLAGAVFGLMEMVLFVEVCLLVLGGLNQSLLGDLLEHASLTAKIWSYAPSLFAMLPKEWLDMLHLR